MSALFAFIFITCIHYIASTELTFSIDNFKQNGLVYPIKMNNRMMKELEEHLDLEDITKNKGIGDKSTVDLQFQDWDIQERIMANICDMDMLKLIAKALRSKPEYLSFLSTDIFCKKRASDEEPSEDDDEEESRAFVGWHQDQSWWRVKPSYALVNLWISFDDIDEEMGPPRFIIDEYIQNKEIFDHQQQLKNNDLQYSIDLNETKYSDEGKIISVELKKYEAMIFSGLTIHGSLPNKTDKRRCGIVYRFTIQSYRDELPIENGVFRELKDGEPYILTPFEVTDRCKTLNLMGHNEL